MPSVKKGNKMPSVVFVCLGNICRSPTAHGVFQNFVDAAGLSEKIKVDSAGTSSWHIGDAPDARAQAEALLRGYDLSKLKARQAMPQDFHIFDYICAMDQSNFDDLAQLSAGQNLSKLHLFMDFAPEWQMKQIPDPYYGNDNGFADVLDMIEAASKRLLADMKRNFDL